MQKAAPIRVRLGPFELDLKAGELIKGQQKIRLQEQPLQILRMLVEASGELVTREEIRKKLWPNDTVVEFDHSIRAAINKLRQALGDSADKPAYVETVARRGYRLLVAVERVDDSSGSDQLRPSPDRGPSTPLRSALDDKREEDDKRKEASNLIGKRVSHYRVLRVIGGGGMGMVYEAEDVKLGRRVALKFLPEELAGDALALQRFEREARTASSLNHPNICYIHEFGEHDGQPFLAMELLEGETLRDRLASVTSSGRKLALDKLLDIAVPICEGLQAAHSKGIIHRDIKPANIFLTASGPVKILDFGLAKLMTAGEEEQATAVAAGTGPGDVLRVIPSAERSEASRDPYTGEDVHNIGVLFYKLRAGSRLALSRYAPSRSLGMTHENDALDGAAEAAPLHPVTPADATLTRAGLAMGTAGYMSPEQVRGEKLDACSDIFSFGLVLYEMATGQRAFTGETAAILKDAILNNTPAPVRELNSTMPAKLEDIIKKATEKEREQRYQSAVEIRADLEILKPDIRKAGEQSSRRWRWMLASAAVVLVALITGGVYWWRTHKAATLTSTDTVVLADFTNNTSDPVFDTALKPTLEVELGQTPFLNLLSAEKVRGTLRLMGHPEDERLTPQLTREVCERTNSRALLAGSISDVGNQYQIELKGVDCQTGSPLANSRATAEDRNEIVRRLGEAGYGLREKLGEPASLLREFNAPLDAAASPSVEALQAYAAGAATFGKLEAVSHFKRAAELDPGFALAHEWLARSYESLYQRDRVIEELTKAYQLSERVSRRDRLSIEARYYWNVTGEAEKARSTLEQAIQLFPRWGQPRILLSYQLRMLGQYEKSAAVARDAQRLMPGDMATYGNLSPSYIALDRLDDARLVLEQEMARVPDNWNMHQYFYLLAFVQDDRRGMEEQVRWAIGKPGIEDCFLWEQAQTEAYYGRLRKAHALSSRAVELAVQAGVSERGAEWKASEALNAAKVGETTRARELGQEVMAVSSTIRPRQTAALALATAGDTTRASQMARQLDQQFSLSTLIQKCELPTIQAQIYLQKNDPNSAIELLQQATPYDLRFSENHFGLEPAYVRGEAYLQAHQGQQAAAEFRKVLEHRGIVGSSINGALAHLQLGRAQVMMGDKAAARKSYQDFLTLWKDADPDIPIYKQAKAEYARLR